MSGEDALQTIADEDLPGLLDVLREDLPTSTVVFHWLCVQREWSKKIPGLRVHVLCPRGEWRRGTVVAFADGLALANKKYGVVYARPRHDAELAAALTSTRAVPWRDVLHFSGVLERHVPIVRAAATAAGVSLPAEQSLCHLLHFPAKLAARIELPSVPDPSVRVCRLEGRHLDEVWRLRPLFPDSYKPVIRACLEHNLSAGVFKTLADGSEVLVSMIMETEYGGMGMGQTHPDFLHRGFSFLALSHLVRGLGERGVSPHAVTWTSNELVLRFARDYGFQAVEKTLRLVVSPGEGAPRARL